MYPKIDIFVNGEYICSTNQTSSCKIAKEKFVKNPVYMGKDGITRIPEGINRIECKYSGKY